jgi:hypothetical protein
MAQAIAQGGDSKAAVAEATAQAFCEGGSTAQSWAAAYAVTLSKDSNGCLVLNEAKALAQVRVLVVLLCWPAYCRLHCGLFSLWTVHDVLTTLRFARACSGADLQQCFPPSVAALTTAEPWFAVTPHPLPSPCAYAGQVWRRHCRVHHPVRGRLSAARLLWTD